MTTARYFRDGNCYWKFDSGHHPQQKTGFYSRWEDSYFHDIEEFLSDPYPVGEIREEEAESKRPAK